MLKLSVKHKDTLHQVEISESETFATLKAELKKLSTFPSMQPKFPACSNSYPKK